MQWLGVGSTHAQRVAFSVPLPPARVDHTVLVWPWRRYVARPRRCPPSGRLLKSKACLGFGCGGRFRHHCKLKRWGVQRTRRQRCGFLTLLTADYAPVPALAVGTERNVGREKASAAPSASRLKLSLGTQGNAMRTFKVYFNFMIFACLIGLFISACWLAIRKEFLVILAGLPIVIFARIIVRFLFGVAAIFSIPALNFEQSGNRIMASLLTFLRSVYISAISTFWFISVNHFVSNKDYINEYNASGPAMAYSAIASAIPLLLIYGEDEEENWSHISAISVIIIYFASSFLLATTSLSTAFVYLLMMVLFIAGDLLRMRMIQADDSQIFHWDEN